jgi:hypothetical protein
VFESDAESDQCRGCADFAFGGEAGAAFEAGFDAAEAGRVDD